MLDEAAQHISYYLESCPDDPEGYLLASRIDRLRAKFFDAENHLNQCKRIAGTDEGIRERMQLEWVLLRSMGGEFSPLEPGLVRCIVEKHPQSFLILEAMAFCYMHRLQYLQCYACLCECLKKEPENVRALSWRGWVRDNLELPEDAHEDYKRALALSPKHWESRLRLVLLLFGQKKVVEAGKHLEMLAPADLERPQVIYALALHYEAQGKLAEAASALADLLALEPENSRALHLRGTLESDPIVKQRWFGKALAIDPTYAEAHFSLYNAFLQQGKRELAAAELKKYNECMTSWKAFKSTLERLEKAPRDPDLLAEVGGLVLSRNAQIGKVFLYKALDAAPNHPRANTLLAQYYEKKKEFTKAAHHRKLLSRTGP